MPIIFQEKGTEPMALNVSYSDVKNYIADFYKNVTETCYQVFDDLKSANVSVADATLVDICNSSETTFNTRVASSEPSLTASFSHIQDSLYPRYNSLEEAEVLTKAISTGLLQGSLNSAQQAALLQLPWETIKYDYCPELDNATAVDNCKSSMDSYQDLSSSLCCNKIITFNAGNAPALGGGVLLAYAFGAGKILKAAIDYFQPDNHQEPESNPTEKLKAK
jgi:hypothetical protein